MHEGAVYLTRPAPKWDDGLPIGNGRLGAMVMGKVREETIILNEESLVYGPDRKRENPDCYTQLEKIRGLLLEGKVEKAAFLAKMAMTSTPKYNNPYQPLGDLHLCFQGHGGEVQDYERRLDFGNAIAAVSYKMNGSRYEREHFVSREYQVLAVRIRALDSENITVSANIGRKPFEEYSGSLGGNCCGCFGENGAGGMHYLTGARIQSEGAEALGDFVYTENQKEVILYLAAQTDYEDCLKGCRQESQAAYENLSGIVKKRLLRAANAGYEAVRSAHIREHRELYDNFSLRIGEMKEEWEEIPTDRLLADYREGDREKEGYLAALLVQYARYLMISSSSDCLLPANLQGIWNGSYEPPWQCQYTININTEMNYWFVEKAGLSKCHLPLFGLLERMAENGKRTAEKLYHSRGFCAHHNTNVWGCTAPEGIFDSSPYWVMGGAWLCLHLYEHYLYTQDKEFLENRAMPLMREAIRFFEDYLFSMPDGSLVTGPVVSPENRYRSPAGESGALCMGTAMDNSILRQLIDSYLEGIEILGREEEEEKVLLRGIREKLPPLKIGKDGRLLEWMEEYQEMEPGHRHISHLYGLHPGHEITPKRQDYFEAAEKTLEYRLANGGGHTGWSRAWLACFAARQKDGDALGSHVEQLLLKCIQDNLLDVHPPFQIDGNFGIAEAILESVVQDENGKITLLPALPPSFGSGSIRGFCLKGGGMLSMEWKKGKVIRIELEVGNGHEYTVCHGDKEWKTACPKQTWADLV